MKTLILFCAIACISISECSAGCPGGVCPTGRFSRSYGVYAGRGYGAGVGYSHTNHREHSWVGAFGRAHTRVRHHHRHTVVPVTP